MIFLTLGTHEQPFERALATIQPLRGGKQLVVQHGHTPARSDWADVKWLEFVEHDRFLELLGEAEAVLCHAGVGTIMSALSRRRRPIVIPRLAELHEHVDDHQLQITTELAKRGLIVPYLPGDDLRRCLEVATAGGTDWQPRGELVAAVGRVVPR